MRTVLIVAAMVLLPACVVGIRPGHYHHHHGYHRHGHWHHWNSAGEAYDESRTIRSLTVLPVILPEEFDGKYFDQEEKQWRRDWPMESARVVAKTLGSNGMIDVDATASETRPVEGYMLNLTITDFDLGDKEETARGPEPEGWSTLTATGSIVNVRTGKTVVDLKFEVSHPRRTDTPPMGDLSEQLGHSLAVWFEEKKAEPPKS